MYVFFKKFLAVIDNFDLTVELCWGDKSLKK